MRMKRKKGCRSASPGQRQMSGFLAVAVGIGLLIGALVTTARAGDPVLQQAQQRLVKLGYELGLPDGIYGPMTRQALTAFQRAQQLPVTGILDAATIQALERVAMPEREMPVDEAELADAPLRVVVAFLLAYADQPSRVLPYVSEQFLQGETKQEWIEKTLQQLQEQMYVHLGWRVQNMEMQEEDTRAVVTVRTRVRVQGEEQLRREQFALRKTEEGGWLIDHWQIDVQPTNPPASTAGSWDVPAAVPPQSEQRKLNEIKAFN